MPDKSIIEQEILNLLQYHIRIHAYTGPEDIYKMFYQGSFGPKHLLGNPDSAKEWLYKEWEIVNAVENHPITEPVVTNGVIVRVNIRPLKFKGAEVKKLWRALLNTALLFQTDMPGFKNNWRVFTGLVEKGLIPFNLDEVNAVWQMAKEKQFPALHHSVSYREANRPAYRVLLLKEFENIMIDL